MGLPEQETGQDKKTTDSHESNRDSIQSKALDRFRQESLSPESAHNLVPKVGSQSAANDTGGNVLFDTKHLYTPKSFLKLEGVGEASDHKKSKTVKKWSDAEGNTRWNRVNADNSWVSTFKDGQGNIQHDYSNKSLIRQNSDGTKFARAVEDENNWEISWKDKDGKETTDHQEILAIEQDRLNSHLYSSENPFGKLQGTAQKDAADCLQKLQQGIFSAKEIAGVFDVVNTLLNKNNQDSTLLAASILHNTAHPRGIRQGISGTCTVVAPVTAQYMHHPAQAAEDVLQIFQSRNNENSFRSPDGFIAKLDSASLYPDPEALWARQNGSFGEYERDFQTQLLAMGWMNYRVQHLDSDALYTQRIAGDGKAVEKVMVPPEHRTGYFDAKGKVINPLAYVGADGDLSMSMMDSDASQEIGRLINGPDYVVITNALNPAKPGYSNNKTTKVHSIDSLRNTLNDLEDRGHLPAGFRAHTSHPMFKRPDNAVFHNLLITNYDKSTDRAYVENSWLDSDDGWVPLSHLYKASLIPELR